MHPKYKCIRDVVVYYRNQYNDFLKMPKKDIK